MDTTSLSAFFKPKSIFIIEDLFKTCDHSVEKFCSPSQVPHGLYRCAFAWSLVGLKTESNKEKNLPKIVQFN